MKSGILLVMASFGVVALAGCASAPSQSSAQSEVRSSLVMDTATVNTVNHVAQQAGVQVIWINPPTHRVTGTETGS
jgi:ABC-type oligopeptide transport system substrate-binding subunit